MKNFIKNIPEKARVLFFFSMICLLLTGLIFIGEKQMQKRLYEQQMSDRWSKDGKSSQISVFFGENAVESVDYFKEVAIGVDKALQEASIVNEKENARLWIDAVSRRGKIVLSSQRATMELNAIGVEGEFFQFHPLKLVKGSLFSGDSVMKDGIVIDEETAWQLFGSSDVAGMQVMIGQVPYFITGVVERPKGRLYEAAGLEKPVCYLSMEGLETYGMQEGGFTYEIVMPNPVKSFAISTMQNIFGNSNENIVILENGIRYQWISLLQLVSDFGIRSMSLKGIVFPYWENVARGYEDILLLTLCMKIMLLIAPVFFMMKVILYFWKKRTWTVGKGFVWLQDKVYEAGVKRVQKKQSKAKKIQEEHESREGFQQKQKTVNGKPEEDKECMEEGTEREHYKAGKEK